MVLRLNQPGLSLYDRLDPASAWGLERGSLFTCQDRGISWECFLLPEEVKDVPRPNNQ